MFIFFRQSYNLPNKFLILNRKPSLKLFNAFSSISGPLRSNTNKLTYRKLVSTKSGQPRPRYFSVKHIQSFYDSVASSEVCKFLRQTLVEAHDLTGLSWTFTIIASSVILRLFVTLPCGIYQQFLTSKLELLNAEINDISKNIKDKIQLAAIKKKWSREQCKTIFQKKIRQQWKILVLKNNCHPFKILILFFTQLPFWLILTLALKSLAFDAATGKLDSPVDSIMFQVGGPFWSKNLTMPDPKFILPIINFLCFIISLEISFLTETQKNLVKKSFKFYFSIVYKYFLRVVGVAFFLICAAQPSAVSLFWASNSFLNLVQKFLIMSPTARRFFKIPKTPSESNKPYSHTWNKFLEKLTGLFLKK